MQLAYGFADKLWHVAGVSKTFASEPYGTSVRARYDELVAALEKKYGLGESAHYRDTDLWKDPDEFLMGIKQGRSWHYTNFRSTRVHVQIGVRALNSSDGYYVIFFENTVLGSEVESDSKAAEEDAL